MNKSLILPITILSILAVILVIGSVSMIKESPLNGSSSKPQPGDRVSYENIQTTNHDVDIEIENPVIVAVANTGSMLPTFGENANLIEIVPKSSSELKLGDIASYQNGNDVIVHRIVELGNDDQGWYAKFKGDNNPFNDPDKVRWSQMKRLVVGIIY
jgi:hypothetical protein